MLAFPVRFVAWKKGINRSATAGLWRGGWKGSGQLSDRQEEEEGGGGVVLSSSVMRSKVGLFKEQRDLAKDILNFIIIKFHL